MGEMIWRLCFGWRIFYRTRSVKIAWWAARATEYFDDMPPVEAADSELSYWGD